MPTGARTSCACGTEALGSKAQYALLLVHTRTALSYLVWTMRSEFLQPSGLPDTADTKIGLHTALTSRKCLARPETKRSGKDQFELLLNPPQMPAMLLQCIHLAQTISTYRSR